MSRLYLLSIVVAFGCTSRAKPAPSSALDGEVAPVYYRLADAKVCPNPETTESDSVFTEQQVSRPISRLAMVTPPYPEELRSANVDGDAFLEFVVNAQGCVEPSSIRVVRTTRKEFADAARYGLRRMRFRPAQRDGRAVRQRVTREFKFRVFRSLRRVSTVLA